MNSWPLVRKWVGRRLPARVLTALLLAVLASCRDRPRPELDTAQRALLTEIISSDDTFSALTPSNTRAYFIYSTTGTNILGYFEGTPGGSLRTVPGTEGVWAIHQWSPSGRYLALQVQEPRFRDYPRQASTKRAWLMLYDAEDGSTRRISADPSPSIESDPSWLDEDTLVFSSVSLMAPEAAPVRREYHVASHSVTEIGMTDTHAILADPGTRILSASPSELYVTMGTNYVRLNRTTGAREPAIGFPPGLLDVPKWVNFSASTGDALFCATPSDSLVRCLFLVSRGSARAEQLSADHSYNGKWLGNGPGFVYVASTNNCFHLVVAPHDGSGTTNLFSDGWCRTFTPSPDGRKIYAEASVDASPCGLWEYDVVSRRLQLIAPGNRMPFEKSMVVAPQMLSVPSFDGEPVPVYFFRRRSGVRALGTVVAIPPPTDQASRYYQARPQFLANVGFDYVAINYRGCDGYGTAASQSYEPRRAARDVVAVVEGLIRDGRISAGPIFLVTQSAGGEVLRNLLDTASFKWNGCVFVRSAYSEALPARTNMPPMLFVCGDQDRVLPAVRANLDALRSVSWPADLVEIENQAHLYVDPEGRRQEESAVGAFLLSLARP